MTTAEDLRAAARYIEQHGKVEGNAELPTGEVCVLAAFAKVIGLPSSVAYDGTPDRRYKAAHTALTAYLMETEPCFYYIPGWSDGTPQDEVVEKMQKAAAWIEEHW